MRQGTQEPHVGMELEDGRGDRLICDTVHIVKLFSAMGNKRGHRSGREG